MSKTKSIDLEISKEELEKLTARLVNQWITADTPYALNNAITDRVVEEIKSSDIVNDIAAGVVEALSKRRVEVAEKVVKAIIDRVGNGLGDVYGEICKKACEEMKNKRYW